MPDVRALDVLVRCLCVESTDVMPRLEYADGQWRESLASDFVAAMAADPDKSPWFHSRENGVRVSGEQMHAAGDEQRSNSSPITAQSVSIVWQCRQRSR